MLYIWKVERTDGWGHDDYSAHICVARTEAEALKILPWEYGWGSSGEPEGLKATKLGTVASGSGLKAGTVLLASFHAG